MKLRSYLNTAVTVILLLATYVRAAELSPTLPRVFLIGGSTMATFPEARPVVGWGQMLPRYFKRPEQVVNRAMSGRSTKSFIDQGYWEKTITDLRAGDFLIMCWGTNDSANDPARRTEPRKDFQANIERFIREIRAKGATPIIATAVARRVWNEQGEFVEAPSEYVTVTREIAAREKIPLMEMRGKTVALEKSLGIEGSRALHLYLEPGKSSYYPNGSKDDTHYNRHGADRVAELAVEEIRRLKLPMADWLK